MPKYRVNPKAADTHEPRTSGSITPALVARPRSAGPGPFVAAVRDLERQGRRIIRLDVGEPHFPTPRHIVEAAVAALAAGHTRYVAPEGILPLRAAIAASVASRGIDATEDDIVVGAGVKPLLLYSLLAVAGPGDAVLVPDPGYAGYEAAARLAGADVQRYPVVRHADRYVIDVDALKSAVTAATRVLILNSPHNPTGMVIDEPTLVQIAALADEHNLWILSDEIYCALTYQATRPLSIAAIPDMRSRTIVVDGFAKAYAMTGWRLGFAVLPPVLVPAVRTICGDAASCVPPFVQHAGIAAIEGPQDLQLTMRRLYHKNRDTLLTRLRGIPGISAPVPAGALYLYADVGDFTGNASAPNTHDIAQALLHEYDVACFPGGAFGTSQRHLRFCFARDEDTIALAGSRLHAWARQMADAL